MHSKKASSRDRITNLMCQERELSYNHSNTPVAWPLGWQKRGTPWVVWVLFWEANYCVLFRLSHIKLIEYKQTSVHTWPRWIEILLHRNLSPSFDEVYENMNHACGQVSMTWLANRPKLYKIGHIGWQIIRPIRLPNIIYASRPCIRVIFIYGCK